MKPFFSSDYLNETIFIAIFQKLYRFCLLIQAYSNNMKPPTIQA